MNTDELHFVYVSRLAPGRDHAAFADICRAARARNAQRGIAGVLIFDGQRFLQWVYGKRDEVRQLMGSIALDARHTDLSVRFEAVLPALDVEPTWRAGFVDADALDALAAPEQTGGATTLQSLERLIEQADLGPPLPVEALRAARVKPGPGTR